MSGLRVSQIKGQESFFEDILFSGFKNKIKPKSGNTIMMF